MVKSSAIKKCSKCHSELDHGICPMCPTTYQDFGIPDFINLQEIEIKQNIIASTKSDKKRAERFKEIITEKRKIYRECKDDERKAAMLDAVEMIANALHSNANVDTIKDIVKIGKRIGDIANCIDAYYKSGGTHATESTPTSGDEDNTDLGREWSKVT